MTLPKIIEIMLPAELEQYIEARIQAGAAHSINEVIHEALWHLQDLDELRRIKQDRLKKEIEKGLNSESKPFTDEDFAAMRRDLRERQGERLKTYWISVQEQLPSKDCLALIAAGDYIGMVEWVQGGWMELTREDVVIGLAHRITHWMPLPALPTL
jgi:putative addiction module CopG family antidote